MIKLLDLLKEDSPFVPRGSKEERGKEYERTTQNRIQQYIKDGMEGDLDLPETPITSLPSNLTRVGGNLDLFDTPITSLPDNLTEVTGNLILNRTKITSLNNLTKVGGSLYLFRVPITSLPDNLTVKRDLDLSYTLLPLLPSNLTVGGDLDLENCEKITKLPNNLTVGGYLNLYNTPLSKKYSKEEIRAMVPNIEDRIVM
jgi:hypothetical protein